LASWASPQLGTSKCFTLVAIADMCKSFIPVANVRVTDIINAKVPNTFISTAYISYSIGDAWFVRRRGQAFHGSHGFAARGRAGDLTHLNCQFTSEIWLELLQGHHFDIACFSIALRSVKNAMERGRVGR